MLGRALVMEWLSVVRLLINRFLYYHIITYLRQRSVTIDVEQ